MRACVRVCVCVCVCVCHCVCVCVCVSNRVGAERKSAQAFTPFLGLWIVCGREGLLP